MAKRHNDEIAVRCPACDFAERGYEGMLCPDCGTGMKADMGAVEPDRTLAGIGKEEGLDDEFTSGSLDTQYGRGHEQSLEELANEEFEKDEFGEEAY